MRMLFGLFLVVSFKIITANLVNQTVLLIQVGRTQLVQTFNGKAVYNCNGIVVRPWWVLTSARCLVNSLSQFRFPQGSSLLIGCTDADSNCPSYELQKIIPHPCYNPQDGFYHDDLALLKLTKDPSKPTPVSYINIDGLDGSPTWTREHPSFGLECIRQQILIPPTWLSMVHTNYQPSSLILASAIRNFRAL